MKKAYLLLKDGTMFEGISRGAAGYAVGEVVFNTSMAGYQEVLTDPSYYGQMVCMTYPLIGNYGINTEDFESHRPWINGFIVHRLSDTPSNWRSAETVESYLKRNNVIAISDIDTRKLTRHVRESGVMNGAIFTEDIESDRESLINEINSFRIENAIDAVTSLKTEKYHTPGAKYSVALLNFGAKRNIINCLTRRGCNVTVMPAHTPPEKILNGGFNGVVLANGPGDPAKNKGIIENIKILLKFGIPVFGICLGHQLLALAAGAQTEKLKYGHRGANHPVTDLSTGRTFITSQNHNYTVVEKTLNQDIAKVSHINLNDKTVEGLRFVNSPVFSVQFHPEGYPGPQDTKHLFDEFITLMNNWRNH
jgi:carbamoyl-phosphate synthase small subunit